MNSNDFTQQRHIALLQAKMELEQWCIKADEGPWTQRAAEQRELTMRVCVMFENVPARPSGATPLLVLSC